MGQRLIYIGAAPEYIAEMSRRVKREFDGLSVSSSRKAGTFAVRMAQRFVPVGETGDLKRSIRAEYSKKQATIYAGAANNRNGFDYSFFVDNKVRATKANLWFHQTRPSNPTGYRGSTGVGFWTATKEATQKEFKDIILKELMDIELVK